MSTAIVTLIVTTIVNCRHDLNSLELVSSTDKKCLWKKHKEPVLQQFEALPTKTFCCVQQDRLPEFSPDVKTYIRDRLTKCDDKTAIAKHRHDLQKKIIRTSNF